jgi:hypothetical protein
VILHEAKYEDDNICKSLRFEVRDIKCAVQGYEVMKASKSFIKDERDLNQDDVG